MVEHAPHPLIKPAPGGLCWKRSDRRRPGRGAQAHQELVVLHALSGEAEYLIDGAIHMLRRRSLLWAFAGQSHVLLSDSEDFDMWVFLISDRVLSPEVKAPFPPLRVPAAGGADPRRISDAASAELERIAKAIRTEPAANARAVGLRWWLLRAWAHWRAATGPQGRRVHPGVARAVAALRSNPGVTSAELGELAGLSSGRLARVFKRDTSMGIGAFRAEEMLARVDLAMRGGRATLTAAALDAGFGSYSQFFRVFRDRRGVSPRDYYREA
ncbi:MAG: AraC family transcriptional regulator [Paracoccaceae bacterium]|nr:AraC family transcriptional regulator [Paracoccaceae bacterium]